MTDVLDLVREDLRDFAGYRSARGERLQGEIWLNANEPAWASAADGDGACRRYPEPQPPALIDALASLYGCDRSQLLIGRGSDEAIDLLVRTLCSPGRDAVLITPPVFGMYAVGARLQGAPLVEVPLIEGAGGFTVDFDAVAEAALARGVRVVFLCSPSNPTGGVAARNDMLRLAARLRGRALIVADEAYVEFSDAPSMTALVASTPNLAVLRTLSKAHALAAARIGALIADPELIAVLRRCQAPYPVPAPCAELALSALSAAALAETATRIASARQERERLRNALATLPDVVRVYPSQGNFLLVRFRDADTAFGALLAAGIVVRDQRGAAQLADALRITVGMPAQNDRLLSVLRTLGVAA